MALEVKPGDWVRFYRSGALVIGKVEYLDVEDTYQRRVLLRTDAGTVRQDCVLEVRSLQAGAIHVKES